MTQRSFSGPDNEPSILDLKRQAAAECRVRHGMTVINDDTTEYESQDNGLAGMAVRVVKGVARSVRSGAERAVQQRQQFEAPCVTLARLLCCRTDLLFTSRSEDFLREEVRLHRISRMCLCDSDKQKFFVLNFEIVFREQRKVSPRLEAMG